MNNAEGSIATIVNFLESERWEYCVRNKNEYNISEAKGSTNEQ